MSSFHSLSCVLPCVLPCVREEVEDELPQKEECLGVAVSGRENPAMLTAQGLTVVLPLEMTVIIGDWGTSIGYTVMDRYRRNWEECVSIL